MSLSSASLNATCHIRQSCPISPQRPQRLSARTLFVCFSLSSRLLPSILLHDRNEVHSLALLIQIAPRWCTDSRVHSFETLKCNRLPLQTKNVMQRRKQVLAKQQQSFSSWMHVGKVPRKARALLMLLPSLSVTLSSTTTTEAGVHIDNTGTTDSFYFVL